MGALETIGGAVGGLPLVGTALSLGGAYMGAEASKDAAQLAADAAGLSRAQSQAQYEQTRADLAPWREAGEGALSTLAGYGRSQVGQGIPSNIPQYDPTAFDLYSDPSYQFRLGEQERAINRNMAGMGKTLSGNRLEEIMRRSGEMASQEYGAARARGIEDYNIGRGAEAAQYARGVDEYGRAYGEETDYLNRLASQAGLGQTSAAQTGQFGASAAANQANALMAAAQAQGAGKIGEASAWQGALGDLGTIAGRYQPSGGGYGGYDSSGIGYGYSAPGSGAIGADDAWEW
jgi:hypothetical protein